MENQFELTAQERHSSLWIKIQKHYEDLLQRERVRNDSPKQTEEGTQFIRGKIALLKELQKLGNKQEEQPEEE